jgi:hypothetical protein
MEKYIKRFVRHILDKKFPLFEDINVNTESNPFRRYSYGESGEIYKVTLIIDFNTYLMNYIEIWNDIKNLIIDKISALGIDNTVKVLINFSDEK